MNNNIPFLLDEEDLSRWAYHYCKDVENDLEILNLITDGFFAAMYCENISKKDERLLQMAIRWVKYIMDYRNSNGESNKVARELLIEFGEEI